MTDSSLDQIERLLAAGWSLHAHSLSTIADGIVVYATQLQKDDELLVVEGVFDGTNVLPQAPNPFSPLPQRRRSFFG